ASKSGSTKPSTARAGRAIGCSFTISPATPTPVSMPWSVVGPPTLNCSGGTFGLSDCASGAPTRKPLITATGSAPVALLDRPAVPAGQPVALEVREHHPLVVSQLEGVAGVEVVDRQVPAVRHAADHGAVARALGHEPV